MRTRVVTAVLLLASLYPAHAFSQGLGDVASAEAKKRRANGAGTTSAPAAAAPSSSVVNRSNGTTPSSQAPTPTAQSTPAKGASGSTGKAAASGDARRPAAQGIGGSAAEAARLREARGWSGSHTHTNDNLLDLRDRRPRRGTYSTGGSPNPEGAPEPGGTPEPTPAPDRAPHPHRAPNRRPRRHSPALRDLARAQGLEIGAAPDGFGDAVLRATLASEFSMVTIPAYWSTTEPTQGHFDFGTADSVAAFATTNAMAGHGHPLVFEVAVPPWLSDGAFSHGEMAQILRLHVQALVSRYRGRIQVWDVVNEALPDDGSTRGALMLWGTVPIRANVFSAALGPEYVEMAFRWAHEADPDAKLFYNDYDTEGLTKKANRLYDLVRGLVERGVPIHGVGFQTHISIHSAPSEDDLRSNFARFAALGVEVQITEMDVDVNDWVGGRPLPLPTGPELSRRLALQAEVYAATMRACLSVPACTGFTTWGVGDAHTWLDWFRNPDGVKTAPLLFDTSYKPKPAYDSLHGLLAKQR